MGQTHSRRDGGNVVFWETHRHRVVDVIGPGVLAKVNLAQDLQPNTIDPDGWTTTVVEAGAGTSEIDPSTTEGYFADVVTAANEDDGTQTQAPGAAFMCEAGRKWYAGLKFKINDATQSDILFGVCITDTTLLGGMTDGAYLECLDGDTGISAVVEKDSTESQDDDEGTLADDTDDYWELYWDGTTLYVYIDGSLATTFVSGDNLPDNEGLRLSLAVLTGEAAAQTMNVAVCRAFAWM